MPQRKAKIDPTPPLSERIFRSLGYFLFFGASVWAVVGELPRSLANITDPWQIGFLAAFLSLSIFASWSTFRGRFYTEYAVLPWIIGSIGIYELAVIYTVATGTNPGSGLSLFIMGGLIACLCSRMASLHQLVTAPRKMEKLKAEVLDRTGGN